MEVEVEVNAPATHPVALLYGLGQFQLCTNLFMDSGGYVFLPGDL